VTGREVATKEVWAAMRAAGLEAPQVAAMVVAVVRVGAKAAREVPSVETAATVVAAWVAESAGDAVASGVATVGPSVATMAAGKQGRRSQRSLW